MSDLTQDGTTLLLAMANAKRKAGTPVLTSANVTLGAPSATAGGSTKNTQVTVTGQAGPDYEGSVVLTYDRVDLDAYLASQGDSMIIGMANPGDITEVSQLVPTMQSNYGNYYGFTIDVADLVNDPIDSSVLPKNITVSFAAGSLRYAGTLAVQLVQTHAV